MTSSSTLKRADVSRASRALVSRLVDEADRLRVGVSHLDNGTCIVDAGIQVPGGLEAGRLIAEICMGGLGSVQLRAGTAFRHWRWQVDVYSTDPVTACLGSQYAGWSLSHGQGKGAFHALGSGPARSIGSKEELFKELDYRNPAGDTCLVLEVDKMPPPEVVDKIISYCGIAPTQLTLVLTPTSSLAGGVQIVGRVLEVALHKVHALHFPLDQVIDGAGTAPVPPPTADFINAMGRTNDAIIYGGRVHLFVTGPDADAENLAKTLPSSASKDFCKPFAEVFKSVDGDFYKIDPMLFSPAAVTVTALDSGRSFFGGAIAMDPLNASFK